MVDDTEMQEVGHLFNSNGADEIEVTVGVDDETLTNEHGTFALDSVLD